MRVTSTRLAILEIVRAGRHFTADDVARAVRERVGHVTLQAVYEALGAFTEAGLLRKVDIGTGPAGTRPGWATIIITSSAAAAGRSRTLTAPWATHPAWSLPYASATSSTRPR